MPQRTYDKGLTLPQLNVKVNETEGALGSTTDMAALPDSSGFTFDGGPPPDGPVLIVQKVAGAVVRPPGGTEIYQGRVWNAGVDVDAVAYRMPAE
jgi:hypothetical protein